MFFPMILIEIFLIWFWHRSLFVSKQKRLVKKNMRKNIKSKNNKNLGKFRIWIIRVGSYLSPINFLLILYSFAKNEPLGVNFWLWMTVCIFSVFGLLIFDTIVMYPSELHYSYLKNPGMQSLEKKINIIIENQNEIINKINN